MAEQPAAQPAGAKAQVLNDRTYQEVEYLKKNLGPILVAALAEICIRRPADPIEYLGHWLLRWRYNEELKRRDVQNALEVVRQKAWSKDDGSMQPPDMAQMLAPGMTPTQGPMDGAVVEQPAAEVLPPSGSGEKRPSAEERRPSGEERRVSQEKRPSTEERRASQQAPAPAAGSGEIKRLSGEAVEAPPAEEPKRASGEITAAPSDQGNRASGEIAAPAEGEPEKRGSRKSGVMEEPSAVEAAPAPVPTEESVQPPAEGEPAPAPAEGEAPAAE